MFPILEFSIASLFTSHEQLTQIQEATFNSQAVRIEQFNSWYEAFYESEGRYPDPAHNIQDAAELNQVWSDLVKTPDYKFKIKFTSPE